MSSLLNPPANHHAPIPLPFHHRRPGPLLFTAQPPRWCCSKSSKASGDGEGGSQSENLVLKLAWYSSELLGIAASFFRPAPQTERGDDGLSGGGVVLDSLDRTQVVEMVKEDFNRSYFVTGPNTWQSSISVSTRSIV